MTTATLYLNLADCQLTNQQPANAPSGPGEALNHTALTGNWEQSFHLTFFFCTCYTWLKLWKTSQDLWHTYLKEDAV
ncbi:MAG: hypothetical protein JW850_12605, partial [Thermoflexales bacterium]|nr:hypothetical protein [Thermoflexales bacterium]